MIRAFLLGFWEGMEDMGLTYDDDAESPRSRAYDYGRSLRQCFNRPWNNAALTREAGLSHMSKEQRKAWWNGR